MIWNFEPFSELERMRREMDGLFDRMGFATTGSYATFPAMNLYESDEDVTILVELPGVRKEDIQLDLRENVLVISGKREPEDAGQEAVNLRKERMAGEFRKTFRLPVKVDSNRADAQCRNGILTLKMAKAEEAKPHQISIQA